MGDKIKAAIIGLGNIGYKYTLDSKRKWTSSHLEAYKKHTQFEPVAICDINEENLNNAKLYYNDSKEFKI